MPKRRARRLPSLAEPSTIRRFAGGLGFDGVGLPAVVLFLDLAPAVALDRISARGGPRDRHENLADMTHARETYLKALRAFAEYRPSSAVHVLDVTGGDHRDVLARAVAAVRPHLVARPPVAGGPTPGTPAGRT